MTAIELYTLMRTLAKEVFALLGPGHSERIYQNAMLAELRNNGIHYDTEVLYPVAYKNYSVGFFRCDIIIEMGGTKMILELKSVSKPYFKSSDPEYVQLQKYLRTTGIAHGMLINFPKFEEPVVFYEMSPNS